MTTKWREVSKLIDDFVDKHPGQECGPAHILLSDGNVADSHILYCLRETWSCLQDGGKYHGGDWVCEIQELWDVFNFLLYLSKIPEDEREEPDEETLWSDGSEITYPCYPGEDPNTVYHKAEWRMIESTPR